MNDRRRTNSAPCGSNSARDSKTESCSTHVNGKRKIHKSSTDVKRSKGKRARPGWGYTSSNSQTSPSVNLPSLEKLSSFSIFIDLDNWARFSTVLYPIPKNVFLWGFDGGNYTGRRKTSFFSHSFRRATFLQTSQVWQGEKCGRFFPFCSRRRAARLDLHTPFIILSGKKFL